MLGGGTGRSYRQCVKLPLNHTEAKDEKRAAAGKRDPSLCVPELKKRGNCTSRDANSCQKRLPRKSLDKPNAEKKEGEGEGECNLIDPARNSSEKQPKPQ